MSVPPYGGPAIPRRRRGTARLTCFYEISDADSGGEPAIGGARPSEPCSLNELECRARKLLAYLAAEPVVEEALPFAVGFQIEKMRAAILAKTVRARSPAPLPPLPKLSSNMRNDLGLGARAEALLKRIQRHNLGNDPLTQFEIRSVLKEIRAIGKMNLAGSLPEDVLARVNRTMEQAVQEASSIVEVALVHGVKNRTD